MSRFSKEKRRVLWLSCLLSISLFSPTTFAQSRRQRPPDRKPPAEVQQPETIESKTPEPDNKTGNKTGDETDETPVRITALKIVGEVQHNFTYYKSNDLDAAIEEFIRTLKFYSKAAPAMTEGGKMNYTEAKEQAKKETDAFVLWLGFMAKDDGYGNMRIDALQYAVIKPRTGKILTRGEINPAQTQSISPGVRLPAPTVRRRTTPVRARSDMKDGARRIAAILARGGWLG